MKRMNRKTEIWSIFGQIEEAVAQAMIDAGKVRKIEQEHIPDTVLYDEEGRKAVFAIIIPYIYIEEFNQREAFLRA
jgi:hypothetical protein